METRSSSKTTGEEGRKGREEGKMEAKKGGEEEKEVTECGKEDGKGGVGRKGKTGKRRE